MPLKSIVVDDEPGARDNLRNLISMCQHDIDVVGDFGDALSAVNFLNDHTVDCLFLDIEMPKMNGFDLVKLIDTSSAMVVFTTAHSHYSIKALRANAIDYLLKPIGLDDLNNAIARVIVRKLQDLELRDSRAVYRESITNLISGGLKSKDITKITVPHTNGFKILDTKHIIRLEGSGAYSRIYLTDGEVELVTRNIGYFDDILNNTGFIRIHNSHLINLDLMKEYSTVDGGTAILKDGTELPIARRRLQEFKDYISRYYA